MVSGPLRHLGTLFLGDPRPSPLHLWIHFSTPDQLYQLRYVGMCVIVITSKIIGQRSVTSQ